MKRTQRGKRLSKMNIHTEKDGKKQYRNKLMKRKFAQRVLLRNFKNKENDLPK